MTRSARGVTLIELLIALAVLATVLVVFVHAQVASLRVTGQSQQDSIATQVASRAMERVTHKLLANRFSCAGGASPDLSCTGKFSDIEVQGLTFEATYDIALPAGPDESELAWMALITVSVAEPAGVEFRRYVSCLDVDPPPGFDDPDPCGF